MFWGIVKKQEIGVFTTALTNKEGGQKPEKMGRGQLNDLLHDSSI